MHIKAKKVKLALLLSAGAAFTAILSLLSLSIGAAEVGLPQLFDALLGNGNLDPIILRIRVPRLITALIVGASLSAAGTVMEAIFRNPLVDPYIGGVASDAAFGASISILLGVTFLSPASSYAIPLTAFTGAVFALILTMIFTRMSGGCTLSFVLSGIAVSFLFSAATTITIILGGKRLE